MFLERLWVMYIVEVFLREVVLICYGRYAKDYIKAQKDIPLKCLKLKTMETPKQIANRVLNSYHNVLVEFAEVDDIELIVSTAMPRLKQLWLDASLDMEELIQWEQSWLDAAKDMREFKEKQKQWFAEA